MKHFANTFLSAIPGAVLASNEAVTQTAPLLSEGDKKTIIVTVVSVIGGLISTVLTRLFKKLFKAKDTSYRPNK
jgi:hypothetical protein